MNCTPTERVLCADPKLSKPEPCTVIGTGSDGLVVVLLDSWYDPQGTSAYFLTKQEYLKKEQQP